MRIKGGGFGKGNGREKRESEREKNCIERK
jgi:hypothetical protein